MNIKGKMMKKILFNSITISIPKNIVQFSLGVILYWILVGVPDAYATALALAGFIIAYSSVYLYNDIADHEEDRKDKEKLKWKLIAGGHISITRSKILTLIFALIGVSISFTVNRWFFGIIILMLFLNLLHSSPRIRFKKSINRTSVNMTAIEFLKFSCGWFALTTDIAKFPFWIMLAFSIVYTSSYLIYKFNFRGGTIRAKSKLFGVLAFSGTLSYILSFFSYGFPLSMSILIIIPLFIIFMFKQMDIEFHRINNMILIEYLLLPVVIISFAVLTIPAIAQANERMATTIDSYAEDLIEDIPETIKEPIENITDELKKYEKLEDIEYDIKHGLGNITNMTVT